MLRLTRALARSAAATVAAAPRVSNMATVCGRARPFVNTMRTMSSSTESSTAAKQEFEEKINARLEELKNEKFDFGTQQQNAVPDKLIEENEKVVGPASKHEFKAETKKLLQIVAKSLYSEQEVFIRELISNAADALEKLRYMRLVGEPLIAEENPAEVHIAVDEAAKTITIQDFGIGMTESDLNDNLGTIARSGSKAFLEKLDSSSDAKDKIIGQFGVGFYSAFMVADQIRVYSRSHLQGSKGYVWTTDLSGTYSIAEAEGVTPGTKIVIHLKEDSHRFASKLTIQRIIKKYSNFVSFPISLNGQVINTVLPLWAVTDKKSITDEQHVEFFRFISGDFGKPQYRLHFSTDSPLSVRSILYIPDNHAERFGADRMEPGVHLYSRKVLIQSKAKNLLPGWLRFVKGVVDCEELSLNISRELLQESSHLTRLRDVLVTRIIKWLRDETKNNLDSYADFFKNFGRFIKEGVCLDTVYQDEIAKLLVYHSTASDKVTTLKGYMDRMKPDQEEIYYLIKEPNSSASSPYLQPFLDRGYEVLFGEPGTDLYVFNALEKFQGKPVVSVQSTPKFLKENAPEATQEDKDLLTYMRTVLGEPVGSIKISNRIKDTPALILENKDMAMMRVMRMLDPETKKLPALPSELEININHPVIAGIKSLRKKAQDQSANISAEQRGAAETMSEALVRQVYDNALLQANMHENPTEMVSRLNMIMEVALRGLQQQQH